MTADGTFDWTDDAGAVPEAPTATAAHVRDRRVPGVGARRFVDLLLLVTLGGLLRG